MSKKYRQTKAWSFIEALTNVIVGYIIAIISQEIIFPIFGISIGLKQQLTMGVIFTVISIVRSYFLRRFFNSI